MHDAGRLCYLQLIVFVLTHKVRAAPNFGAVLFSDHAF